MNYEQLGAESSDLLELARKLAPEGERLDLTDREYTLDELVELRAHLATMRKSIDVVNNGLANYWDEVFPGELYEDEYKVWWVGKTRQRKAVDGEMLVGWFSSLDEERVAKMVHPNRLAGILKVSAMTPVERETHLSEEFSKNAGISINSKDRK